jgi:hypothetical protein
MVPDMVWEIVGRSGIGVTMMIYAHSSSTKRKALGKPGDTRCLPMQHHQLQPASQGREYRLVYRRR